MEINFDFNKHSFYLNLLMNKLICTDKEIKVSWSSLNFKYIYYKENNLLTNVFEFIFLECYKFSLLIYNILKSKIIYI